MCNYVNIGIGTFKKKEKGKSGISLYILYLEFFYTEYCYDFLAFEKSTKSYTMFRVQRVCFDLKCTIHQS